MADLAVGGVVLFACADEEALEVRCFRGLVYELAAEVGGFPGSFLELAGEGAVGILGDLGLSSLMLAR